MIATNGYLEVNGKRVEIIFVGLEEDAARRTAETKDNVTFRLDRLGIPLLEVTTGPNISTAEEAKEVALKIGRLVRATGKARRGIGTIRQDVNVSIKGHPRVELKGFQDLKSMPETIRYEIKRQQEVIYKKEKLEAHVRNVKEDGSSKYLRPMPGASRMYPETDHPFITVTPETLLDVKKHLPEIPEKKLARLIKAGLNDDLANQVLFDNLFSKLHKQFPKIDPKLIATTILSTQKEVKKKLKHDEGEFEQEHFEKIFKLLEQGKISKEAIYNILLAVAQGDKVDSAAKNFQLMSDADLKKEIAKFKKQFSSAPEGKLKGVIIGKLRGKADVQKIMKLLNS